MAADSDPINRSPSTRAMDRINNFLDQRIAPLEAPDETEGLESFSVGALTGGASALRAGGWVSPLRSGFRRNSISNYRQRQRTPGLESFDVSPTGLPGSPAAAGTATNWMPIGPSVVRHGQADTRPAVSGRIDGIAIAPGGQRVYVASANGGVWRSDNGGSTWLPTMDNLELNDPKSQSDSLACGAIALHPADPDTVYVGTGEPFGALDSYFGAGPSITHDGGKSWNRETADPDSASLDGTGFFRLAVDPNLPDRVIAATRNGLYRREPLPSQPGVFQWFRKKGMEATSVVATSNAGATIFYAALIPGGVFQSTDGDTWTSTGSGLPQSTGVISLAVRPNGPAPVYALVTNASTFHAQGVFRLDPGATAWLPVAGHPADLFGGLAQNGQGWYDSSIAVSPADDAILFLGGASKAGTQGASFYRCTVAAAGEAPNPTYNITCEWIGTAVHADIHALEFTPGNPSELWAGCDGGLFHCAAADASPPIFEPRNTGLATLTMNHLGMHPTEDAVLFCGVQDNGTVRYVSSEAWLHSAPGDGGYVVVHPDQPARVLRSYIMNILQVSTDGGKDYISWHRADVPLDSVRGEAAEFYAPVAGGPTGLVAFGSRRLWLSDFGALWKSIPNGDFLADDCGSFVSAIQFQSATRIFIGTSGGRVYRFDQQGSLWTRQLISAAPLLAGRIKGIALDFGDATGASLYVCFGGGPNDFRHVWHFDGSAWTPRSGSGSGQPDSLLALQHNAIVSDPANPSTLYAAADLGVWRSLDGGHSWDRFTEGLPEAAVIDLKLHPTRRLLWAATHGRGVFERIIDPAVGIAADYYIRDTLLDTGRRATIDGLDSPAAPGTVLTHTDSPDIKVDVPSADGSFQTSSAQIDFLQFEDAVTDRSALLRAGGSVVNRVFVQVHNRSRFETPAQLTVLVGIAGDSLPAGFESTVTTGAPIGGNWKVVGTAPVNGALAGHPVIVALDFPSALLIAPAAGSSGSAVLLALVHSDFDAFTSTTMDVDALVLADKKVAEKRLVFS